MLYHKICLIIVSNEKEDQSILSEDNGCCITVRHSILWLVLCQLGQQGRRALYRKNESETALPLRLNNF